jgi:hypothetical protein
MVKELFVESAFSISKKAPSEWEVILILDIENQISKVMRIKVSIVRADSQT